MWVKRAIDTLPLLWISVWLYKRWSRRCTNFEAQVVTRIDSRIHSPAGRTKALALANYYLYNEGGNFSAVAQVALGFNIDATVAKINSTRAQLQTVYPLSLKSRRWNKFYRNMCILTWQLCSDYHFIVGYQEPFCSILRQSMISQWSTLSTTYSSADIRALSLYRGSSRRTNTLYPLLQYEYGVTAVQKLSAGYILRPPLLAVAVAVDGIVESLVEQIKLGEQFLSYERVRRAQRFCYIAESCRIPRLQFGNRLVQSWQNWL